MVQKLFQFLLVNLIMNFVSINMIVQTSIMGLFSDKLSIIGSKEHEILYLDYILI